MATATGNNAKPSTEMIDVRILDRSFRLSVPAHEKPQLERAVRLVDDQMRKLRDAGKITGMDRIAVMAALQIANDLVALRGASPTGSAGETNLKRIRSMNERLEEELKRQESLF